MPLLRSKIDRQSPSYQTNYSKTKLAVERLSAELHELTQGGGEKYVKRHLERGKLLPRDRVEILLDEGSYFLEIAPLAGFGMENEARGAGLVGGIGLVSGRECVITANEATIKGGAISEIGLRKSKRLADIAAQNRLPTISLVESAGADLPVQHKIFVPGGGSFRDITRMVQGPHSYHRHRVRKLHGGRSVSARHVGLRGDGQERSAGVPGRSAPGQNGHR